MAPKSFGLAFVGRTIRVNSIRKGLLGGSKFWMAVLLTRFIGTKMQRVTKRGEKPLRYSEPLRPGEQIVISHIDPRAGGN